MNPKKMFEQSEKERVYEAMQKEEPGTARYKELLEVYLKLSDDERKGKISKDTVAQIGANLLGIGMILKHEELHVIATKAMNFVVRGRL